ncbi:MAG: glycosyltransferase family 4 protein, partial [Chlorobi bacterium]|nr:glycosyltransferase family 4 protein [Chlorobiota bacterium]
LHFHDFTTFINWFLPLRFFLRKPTYAITYHGFEGWPIRWKHKVLRRFTSWLMHVRLGVGDYISEYYGHQIDSYYIGAPVHFHTEERAPVRRRFVFIGRLERDTEILPFVRCLHAAANTVEEPLTLRLIGDGSLLRDLLALRSEKLEISHIPATNSVEEELQAAEFVVCTGFLALFDAFSFQRPALVPAFSEIKKQYFKSIPAIERMAFIGYGEGEMVQLLRRLLEGEETYSHDSVVCRAGEFVSNLSWKSIALQHLALYEKS